MFHSLSEHEVDSVSVTARRASPSVASHTTMSYSED